jgi:hypothetical protein
MEIRARWWRVPAASVPRAIPREAQLIWLYDWWQRIDAWITAENSGTAAEQGGPLARPAAP